MNSTRTRWFAIETSSSHISMALGEDAEVFRELSRDGNASILAEPIFRELEVALDQIDQCVISQGPGSYNGLRVGYALLKGLLCLHLLPVVQVPTSLILAKNTAGKLNLSHGSILILNNARCNELYGAWVDIQNGWPLIRWESVCDEKMLLSKVSRPFDAIASYDYTANDLPVFNHDRWISLFPSASTAGRIAYHLKLTPTLNLSQLEPYYVRAHSISQSVFGK